MTLPDRWFLYTHGVCTKHRIFKTYPDDPWDDQVLCCPQCVMDAENRAMDRLRRLGVKVD